MLHPVTHHECSQQTGGGGSCDSTLAPGRRAPGGRSGTARKPETKEAGSSGDQRQRTGPRQSRTGRNPRAVQAGACVLPRLSDPQFCGMNRSQSGRTHHAARGPAGT